MSTRSPPPAGLSSTSVDLPVTVKLRTPGPLNPGGLLLILVMALIEKLFVFVSPNRPFLIAAWMVTVDPLKVIFRRRELAWLTIAAPGCEKRQVFCHDL